MNGANDGAAQAKPHMRGCADVIRSKHQALSLEATHATKTNKFINFT